MKKLIPLLLLLFPLRLAGAAEWDRGNPFIDMMRSMLDIFEMMELYDDFSAQAGRAPGQYAPSWAPQAPPPGAPATIPPFAPQSITELEGAWANHNNILLAIKQNYGRIYWSRDQYRNLHLEIIPPRLRLTDADTGQSQEFDIALQGDQLVLRDDQGRLAQFKRIRQSPAPK